MAPAAISSSLASPTAITNISASINPRPRKAATMPSMTVTSAAMRELRRKQQNSRIALAGGIAKTSPEPVPKGTKVRVRTSAGRVCTGQRLVIVLDAVVLSATEDGYVVYNGNPLETLSVAKDEVTVI